MPDPCLARQQSDAWVSAYPASEPPSKPDLKLTWLPPVHQTPMQHLQVLHTMGARIVALCMFRLWFFEVGAACCPTSSRIGTVTYLRSSSSSSPPPQRIVHGPMNIHAPTHACIHATCTQRESHSKGGRARAIYTHTLSCSTLSPHAICNKSTAGAGGGVAHPLFPLAPCCHPSLTTPPPLSSRDVAMGPLVAKFWTLRGWQGPPGGSLGDYFF